MATLELTTLFKDMLDMAKAYPAITSDCAVTEGMFAASEAMLAINPTITVEEAMDAFLAHPTASAKTKYWYNRNAIAIWGKEFSPDLLIKHMNIIKDYALAVNDGGSSAGEVLKMKNCALSAKDRSELIKKVVDPLEAFEVYLAVADLTDAEDALLEAKFVGKLPTAEKELADGDVERAKPTAITPIS